MIAEKIDLTVELPQSILEVEAMNFQLHASDSKFQIVIRVGLIIILYFFFLFLVVRQI